MSELTVLDGDCLSLLPTIPGAFGRPRLIFADPPYNIGVNYGGDFDDARPDDVFRAWCRGWIAAAADALADDGSFFLLVNHQHVPWLTVGAVERAGLHWKQTITWYETFGVNMTKKYNLTSRPLVWFVKDPGRFVFNADAPEIRRPSDRQLKYNDKRANPKGKLLDDVWTISRVAGTFGERIDGFPTQLPIELLRRVVAGHSDPGDLVLDPFNGSGTTGAACVELGRRYVGCELNPDFAEKTRRRLAGMPSPLFV